MSNMQTAQESYAAFGKGDMDSLKTMLSPDITWVSSDEIPDGGEIHGADETIAAFQKIPTHFPTFSVSPKEFIDGGEWVVVRGTETVGTNKGEVTTPYVHLLKFENEKIVRGEYFTDTAKEKALL